jgi:hypothetical protein
MVGEVNARPSASTGGRIGAGLRQRMAGLAWHARRTGLDGGRRRLAGDDRFETQIVVMASDSDAVSWLRLGGRFVFGTHCVRDRAGSSRAFGFNTNWRMPVRPTASTLLSPVWTPATSNSTSRSTTNQSPDMTLSPPPRAEVYLVENRLNPISTRAALELTDDNLRCTVKEYSKWVEKALGISDLRSRLQAGEAVAAFDFRRDQLKIKWLKQFLKAGFSVSEGSSRRWLVSLVYPTGIMALVEVVDGWDVHNEWRRALPPT